MLESMVEFLAVYGALLLGLGSAGLSIRSRSKTQTIIFGCVAALLFLIQGGCALVLLEVSRIGQ